jgi:TniQ
MAAIPIRLAPLPGEALDSWLEAYADLLHVTVRDIFTFAGASWDRDGGRHDVGKPWIVQLDEPDLAALSAATGIPAGVLAGMTLARYQGTGLAEVTAPPGMRRTPRWWRQLSCSRYCPSCLAANGGRWMLAWRIPWAFACTGCQVLLADTCPDCGRRHRRTRTGQPREPGRCDLTGLCLPPPRLPGATTFSCTSDPAATPAVALPAGGLVLAAQQHVDALISALLASRGRPAETAALRQQLDDIYAVARAAASAVNGPAALPPAAAAVLGELAARPGAPASQGPGDSGATPSGPVDRYLRQLAPVAAFGTAVADIMLHGRAGDPDPEIAAWLAANGAIRRSQPGPGDMLAEWNRASPALQAALAGPLAARLDSFRQLRYRAVAGPARIPRPSRARGLAAVLPALIWPGWALRLMPPEGANFMSYRVGLTVMLAVAVTGAPDCRTARELIGLHPAHPGDLATFASRLREHGILEPVTAAICQLARQLEDNGTPIDYARRRRLPRLAQAQLDVTAWRRQRHILRHPATWGQPQQPGGTALAAAPVREHLARLRLIELLTGTHPRYLPGELQLPAARTQHYSNFTLTMPAQLDLCLRRQASALLSKASIDEPVAWEPPPGWITGVPWPGPDPDSITPGDLHPLIRARLPASAIAAKLATTADHVLLAAARNPAPRLHGDPLTARSP